MQEKLEKDIKQEATRGEKQLEIQWGHLAIVF
jgi:hypothetical protein